MELVRLYRNILKLHKQKLPPHMRVLGDQYIRDEFRRHKNADHKFLQPFLQEWKAYEEMLIRKEVKFGENLTKEQQLLLDEQQKVKLQDLQKAAVDVGKTIR